MSVHEKDSELSQKIWAGDYLGKEGALECGLAKFKRDHDSVSWMSTLYSALGRFLPAAKGRDRGAIRIVLWCLWHLQPLVSRFKSVGINFSQDEIGRAYSSDQCDVIASVLLRWSQAPWTSGLYLAAAKNFARSAYMRSKDAIGGHISSLAALTLARIHLKQEHRAIADSKPIHRHAAQRYLDDASNWVALIQDPNQRSRVYRGIAEVAIGVYGHTHDGTLLASRALEEADAVPDIGEDVKTKNAQMRAHLNL